LFAPVDWRKQQASGEQCKEIEMQNLPTIDIDWANVNWLYVTVLAIFVFFSTIIGTLLSFKHVFYGAVLSALLFATAFVFWNYYPHSLPLPTLMTAQQQVPANSDPTVRAHAKSPVYVVIAIQKITDPEAYKPLPEKGKAAAEAAGGHCRHWGANVGGGADDDCSTSFRDATLRAFLRGGGETGPDRGGDDLSCVMSCSTACDATMFWDIWSCLAAS
jgi:hypothetical protein